MVEYKIFVNQGVEAFGTTGKTLSIEECPRTISTEFLAEEMHHANELIPKRTIQEVLSIFGSVAARLMAEGFAMQFMNDGDVVLRLYADAKIKGGNINLDRAKQLDPEVTEITAENATALVQKAGVQLRAYAEVQRKFNELLDSFKPSAHAIGVTERAYVERKDGTEPASPTDNPSGGDNGGNTGGNTGGDNGGNGGGGNDDPNNSED